MHSKELNTAIDGIQQNSTNGYLGEGVPLGSPVGEEHHMRHTINFCNNSGFSVANQINQQYAVDLYLNDAWEGNAATGSNYQGQLFLGRTAVTVATNGTGAFSITLNSASSNSPLGMFVTATTTATRPATGVARDSTSEFSRTAIAVTMPGVGPAASGALLAQAMAVQQSTPSTSSSTPGARQAAFGQIGR